MKYFNWNFEMKCQKLWKKIKILRKSQEYDEKSNVWEEIFNFWYKSCKSLFWYFEIKFQNYENIQHYEVQIILLDKMSLCFDT